MLRFQQFALDPQRARLWRNGKRVRLPRAAMRLLVSLATNAGDVVDRRQAARHIWGRANNDTDRRLNAVVSRLRKALRDTGIDPKLVVTVPRRGYRLAASVSETPTSPKKPADVRRAATVVAAAVAVAVAAYAATTFVNMQPGTAHTAAVPASANRAYREALALMAAPGAGDLERAETLLGQAVAQSPAFADAWASLASLWLRKPVPPAQAMPQAKQAALQALQHDADSVTAKLRLADVAVAWDADWAQAEEYALSARDSAPNNAATHQAVASLHYLHGRPGEGEAALLMAMSIDPQSPSIQSDMARYYTAVGQYEKAIAACDRLARLRETAIDAGVCALQPLLLSGRVEDAADLARGALQRSSGRLPSATLAPDVVLSLLWRNTLAGLTEASRARYVDPVQFARLHAQMGDRPRALAALGQAVEQRSPLAARAHLLPELRSLHEEPAFHAVLRKAGMPEPPRQVLARIAP